MALTPEEEAELAELEKQVGPEFLRAGGSVTPAPENSLGVTGVINQPAAEPSHEESEVGRIASALDPRFDLIPQGLALLPGTNDPRGDEAAIHAYKAGTAGPVKFAYEPPVAVVRKQLLENPNMLRLLRSDPPSPEEIAGMDESSPIYQDAANYMWARTSEEAAKKGHTVYRYSKMPWGQENDVAGGLGTLGLKLGGAMQPIQDIKDTFVLGFDDTATLGAARAAQETLVPEQKMNVPGNVDVMGLDESAPQKTADLNQWQMEESPIAYGAGQVAGAVVGAPRKIYNLILEGGDELSKLVAKTRLGALADSAPWVRGAAGLGGEVAAGAVEAAGTQAGQEAVDMVNPNTRGPVLEAGERVLDTGESAALWSLGGAGLGRLAGFGADAIRNADRFGGAVGRTESSLSYGPLSPLLGPSLSGETKDIVRRANREGNEAGDYIAEKIAPAIQGKAAEHTKRAIGRERSETANFHQTTEGQAELPVTHLQQASLERLRAHHQPQAGKQPHPVDDRFRPAQKVFNRLIDDVSFEPIEGAVKLSPDEAGAFLGGSWRYKLLKDDIEGAAAKAKGASPEPIERDGYLRTIKDKRARDAAEEEIDASIDDILGDANPTAAAYERAEQQVLRERVEEESFIEATGGTLGDYIRARGKDAVYVRPRGYDAKRTETLIKGLGDEELVEAAKLDRQQRPMDGKKGGWEERRKKHADDIAKAKATEESIAPKESAFEAVASHADKRAGDKERADVLRRLADETGTRGDLDRLRNLVDARNIQRQAWFRSPKNSPRGFGVQNIGDAAMLRAFPVLRALEPGGDVTGGMMSRMALMGQIEDEKARQSEVDRGAPAYEKRRAGLQKQKDDKRAKEKKERERRRTEKHRDD